MSATWEIREGDALDRLREMPDEGVHCCVTSPPYFGLRDYGGGAVDWPAVEYALPGGVVSIEPETAALGLERRAEAFIGHLVLVFREVHRVLRADGTLWLNIGDSYATVDGRTSTRGHRGMDRPVLEALASSRPRGAPPHGDVKRKDLVGIPWLLAFALRADGWYLRQEIIWAKRSPMPDPVRDRCTRAHEQLFMLAKSPRYFYDTDAIAEDAVSESPSGNGYKRPERMSHGGRGQADGWVDIGGKRNRRDVWTLSSQPFPDAHFATFPPLLVEPCILAGSAERCCSECGAPWQAGTGPRRGLDMSRPQARRAVELAEQHELTSAHIDAIRACGISDTGRAAETQTGTGRNDPFVQALASEARDVLGGYYREFLLAKEIAGEAAPTCDHESRGGASVVLDPFAGAGTVGLVALRHGRSFIGIELNADYVELARGRIVADAPLLNAPAEAAA